MTLYLKYRPQNISSLDSPSVRESLTKILKSGNIPHAFLFSGPRGTGKTSTARILAKALNCDKVNDQQTKNKITDVEPCGECDQCLSIARGENLDVIELDAASNRGIDDIRTLRESIKLAPTQSRKKVYIIDEAHMLTVEASNAFLKTLEEPPEHVVFILATTNPEKLIPTIRSRVTNIVFHKANEKEIASALIKVAEGQGVKVDEKTLNLIGKNSEGSYRDAVKLFEELENEGIIENFDSAKVYLEGKSNINFEEILISLVEKDTKKLIDIVERSIETGTSIKYLLKGILASLQEKLLVSVGVNDGTRINLESTDLLRLIDLISKASQETNTLIEQLPLEIALVEWCEGKEDVGTSETNEAEKPINTNVPNLRTAIKKDKISLTQINSKLSESENKEEVNPNKNGNVILKGNAMSSEIWQKILYQIKPLNSSTEALLRASRPMSVNDETLILGVYYKFHKERLEERPHKELLYQTVSSVLGKSVKIICELTEPPSASVTNKKATETPENSQTLTIGNNSVLTEAKDDDIIKVAEDIFGSD